MRRLALFALALALAAFTLPAPARAAPLDPAQDAQVRAIVRDYLLKNPEVIEEAMGVLEARRTAESARRAAEQRPKIEGDKRHFVTGPANARITVVEFFDYRCPYCHDAYNWLDAKLRTRKDIRYVFVEFPILGPNSLLASRAAVASMKQGRYLAFHRALMASRGPLDAKRIDVLAKQSGLDVARLRRDMGDPAIMKLLENNHAIAEKAQITGTPAFMINGEFFHGFDPAAMDAALRKLSTPAKKKAAG